MARRAGPSRVRVDADETAAPDRILTARLLILAPHMDDETLACGGTVLRHQRKSEIHCLFATDGAASPSPLFPWLGRADPNLATHRRQEAVAVATCLGIPGANLRFLDLPDGRLAASFGELTTALRDAVLQTDPDIVLAPFRYDVHPDHTTLNRAARQVLGTMRTPPQLMEYFVYFRQRFLPHGDVRRAVAPERLLSVDIAPVATAKRAALDCYRTQTTILYSWQERPTLTAESLDHRCREPEVFLPTDPTASLADDLTPYVLRIRLACLAMRWGKRPKDRLQALWHRLGRR